MSERTRAAALTADEVARWLRRAQVADVAFVHGAAFQLMAIDEGVSVAYLYADFAARAAKYPDCRVVHQHARGAEGES